jgi:hypothetical protein
MQSAVPVGVWQSSTTFSPEKLKHPGRVAQLVEHSTLNRLVVGSIPTASTIFLPPCRTTESQASILLRRISQTNEAIRVTPATRDDGQPFINTWPFLSLSKSDTYKSNERPAY